MGPGDLLVQPPGSLPEASVLPNGEFEGSSIQYCLPEAEETARQLSRSLLHVEIELRHLAGRFQGLLLLRNPGAGACIFSALYLTQGEVLENYGRLKAVELLLFLDSLDLNVDPPHIYIRPDLTALMEEVRDYLVEHVERHITLEDLTAQFHLSQTVLKRAFKAVFGIPVGTYMRSYRIQLARQLLEESDLEIDEIARRVGYESPSRFSTTFQKHTGCPPGIYRRQKNAAKTQKKASDPSDKM